MKLKVSSALIVSTLALALIITGCGSKESASVAAIATQGTTPKKPSKKSKKTPPLDQLFAGSPESTVELKYAGAHDQISSQGVIYTKVVATANQLPRGAAFLTSTGDMGLVGITDLIHAVTGTTTSTDADSVHSLEGVKLSIKNAMILAQKRGHVRVAISPSDSANFGVPSQELAEATLRAVLEFRGTLQVRMITVTLADANIYRNTLALILAEPEFATVTPNDLHVMRGNITKFHHGASAIVIPGNMEATFDGGLISKACKAAAGNPDVIEAEAKTFIQAFNVQLLRMLNRK